jgi:23S rRNA U2552 (ribose-2'-O)-methylase RlmE/FtsJ
MNQPFIFKLESGKSEVLENKPQKEDVLLSSSINLPLNSLGFHTFLHRTKKAMDITKKMQSKNEIYYVVNPFELVIPNYEDSLNNLTKHYLSIKSDERVETTAREFYKFWEMLFLFNVADQKEINCGVIGNNSEVISMTLTNFRQKLGSGGKKDKINVIDISKQSVKSAKNNDNLDLVLADSEIKVDDENFQEQESYQLLLKEIIMALSTQAKGGNFILKIFETFTLPSIKLVYLLSSFYDETYIYKPYFSRASTSEKYLVCKGFKGDKTLDNKIKLLENATELMNSIKFVFDIFPSLILPQTYLDTFKFINIKVANPQQIMINEIVKYIKENNYYGEKYHNFREKQIEATKWWVNYFYPPSDNLFQKNKEELEKLIQASEEKNKMELDKFIAQIVS